MPHAQAPVADAICTSVDFADVLVLVVLASMLPAHASPSGQVRAPLDLAPCHDYACSVPCAHSTLHLLILASLVAAKSRGRPVPAAESAFSGKTRASAGVFAELGLRCKVPHAYTSLPLRLVAAPIDAAGAYIEPFLTALA